MIRFVLAALLLVIPPVAQAQQDHQPGASHAAHGSARHHGSAATREPGQAAFAAIQEIVGILVADPDTDWSTVDIDALRRHLVDMSNVTLYAKANAVPVKSGVRYEVTGHGEIGASIRRMVAAHATTMNGRDGWTYRAEHRPAGAAMIVTVANPAELPKLRGLGFFGVLALGMHHPTHHFMIATGQTPHR